MVSNTNCTRGTGGRRVLHSTPDGSAVTQKEEFGTYSAEPFSATPRVALCMHSAVREPLDGRDFLETDAEIGDDGKLHVTVRKSNASRRSLGPGSFSGLTPHPSNLTGAEIYSLSSSRNPTPRGSNFNTSDFYNMMGVQGFPGGRLSNFGPADLYSVQSSRGPTPRPSNFEENCAPMATNSSPRFGFYPAQTVPTSYPAPNPEFSSTVSTKNTKNLQQQQQEQQQQPQQQNSKANHDAKELHMFVWSSSASPVSDVFGGNDFERVMRDEIK
ncbi:hypothetical protein MANES_05G206700v8 [Manihot esculenta]|uniref:Uncharacterized protein n=1 Tax=Manihot esculenta TaxID=3983 RepID=A0ACB7HRZ3_MANES|nr:hypothetical protein MANES_05G206700v8 [Manihot esculenta]